MNNSHESNLPSARGISLTQSVNSVLLANLIGFALITGKPVLLPIRAATIAVYVLVSASEALALVPLVRALPEVGRRILVLLIFTIVVVLFMGVVLSTVSSIVAEAAVYQANIEKLVAEAADFLQIEERPDWQTIRDATIGKLSISSLFNVLVVNITGIGGAIFLIVVYAAFLFSERASFSQKLAAALQDKKKTAQAQEMIRDINERIAITTARDTLFHWAC